MSSRADSTSESVVATTTARTESSLPSRTLIVVGLAIGAVLGFGGNFIHVGPAQNVVYTISSLGIIMGSALFAAWFARQGRDTVAVGFALLALAEGILLSGLFLSASTPTDRGAYASFAAGVVLYTLALLLVSLPPAFLLWTHIAGALAAMPFAAYALLSLLGRSLAPGGPLASIGYVLLILAIVGWMIAVLWAAPLSQRETAIRWRLTPSKKEDIDVYIVSIWTCSGARVLGRGSPTPLTDPVALRCPPVRCIRRRPECRGSGLCARSVGTHHWRGTEA